MYEGVPSQPRMFGWLTAGVIGLVVLGAVITAALWGFGVLTAGVKGKGEAFKTKESAVNRIQKQEMFEQLNADIDGYVVKVSLAKQAAAAATTATDQGLRQTELVGVRQVCVDAVQQYNAESRKYTSRDFKSAGLPYRRDPAECK